jgi:hypothetical protein
MLKKILFFISLRQLQDTLAIDFEDKKEVEYNQNEILHFNQEVYNKLNNICFKVFNYIIEHKLLPDLYTLTDKEIQDLYGQVFAYIINHEAIKAEIIPLCYELIHYEKAIELCEIRETFITKHSRNASIVSTIASLFAFGAFSLGGISPTVLKCKTHQSFFSAKSCLCDTSNTFMQGHFLFKSILAVIALAQVMSLIIEQNKHTLFHDKKDINDFQNLRLESIYNTMYTLVTKTMMEYFENIK